MQIHVACLCAAWCRLCDDYRPVLERALAELTAAGIRLQRHWIDIEDDAELVGDLDVETFPTIVVFDARHVRFAGPVTPQPETLRRLLRSLAQDVGAKSGYPIAPEAEAFAQRLRG